MKNFEKYLKAVQTEGYSQEAQAIAAGGKDYYSYKSMFNNVSLPDAVKSYEKQPITVTTVDPPRGMVYAEDVNDVKGGEVVNGGTFPQQGIKSSTAVKDLSLSYFTFYNNGNQIKEIVYSEAVKGKMFWYFIPKGKTTMYILPGFVPEEYSYRVK